MRGSEQRELPYLSSCCGCASRRCRDARKCTASWQPTLLQCPRPAIGTKARPCGAAGLPGPSPERLPGYRPIPGGFAWISPGLQLSAPRSSCCWLLLVAFRRSRCISLLACMDEFVRHGRSQIAGYHSEIAGDSSHVCFDGGATGAAARSFPCAAEVREEPEVAKGETKGGTVRMAMIRADGAGRCTYIEPRRARSSTYIVEHIIDVLVRSPPPESHAERGCECSRGNRHANCSSTASSARARICHFSMPPSFGC